MPAPGSPVVAVAPLASATASERVFQRMFSLRHEFAKEWFAFLHSSPPELSFDLLPERFPFQARGRGITVKRVFLLGNPDTLAAGVFILTSPGGTARAGVDAVIVENVPTKYYDLTHIVSGTGSTLNYTWSLGVTGVDPSASGDIVLVFEYTMA